MKYNVVDIEGRYWIELLEDPYNGIRYAYGKVGFEEPPEGEDSAILQFEYELYDQRLVVQLKEDNLFNTTIGDILIELIEQQLAKGEIVYTGGE